MSSPDPIADIAQDRARARAAADPLADTCILATSDGLRVPGVRPLVLRDVGPQGVGLLVSATSPKWEPLRGGRYECLLIWLTVRRQYRIRGGIAPMPDSRVDEYWQQKVHESKLLDLYYEAVRPQSSAVESYQAFRSGIDRLRAEHPAADAVPRPPLLRGIYLIPFCVEAWHGSPDRLHDRRLYTRRGERWIEQALVP